MNKTGQQTSPRLPESDSGQGGRSRWRTVGLWALRLPLIFMLVFNLLALPLFFTTRITPPASPADPVTVYLIEYGMSSSIALPLNDGGIVRYVYADWNYYVCENRGWTDAAAALCWPTTASLGRQRVAGPGGEEAFVHHFREMAEAVYELEVDRQQVDRLRNRLDAIFDAHQEDLFHDESFAMDFVPHPHNYTYFHNSNHVTAGWLRELGCDVRGPAFDSRWEVK